MRERRGSPEPDRRREGGRLSTGYRLVERLDRGVPEEEFDAYIDKFVAEKTFYFLPTTLDQLFKGGRIGRASHLMGTLLNIKPVLSIDEGVVDVFKKVRGVRQALEVMRDGMLERTRPGLITYVSLSHGLNEPVLEQLRGLVEGVTDRNVQIRLTSLVGSVIGTYAGPGAVALSFIQE
jgi:DegV family protein with EDD domain